MMDASLVAKRLAFIETCLRELRNILVHGYTDVDLDIVRHVLEHRLADLEAFVATIRARI